MRPVSIREVMIPRAFRVPVVFFLAALGMFGCVSAPPWPPSVSPAVSAYDDPDQLQALISDKKEVYYLVDVRTIDEYEKGHITTALNIPYDMVADYPPTPYKDTLIIVYCASGTRSAAARQTLEELGYFHVVDFGSLSRWKGALIPGRDPTLCSCGTS